MKIWRLVSGPGVWAGFSLLLSAFSMAEVLKPAFITDKVLHRHKREWVWKKMYAQEEMIKLPQIIGKLDNTKYHGTSRFILRGEGANDIFTVNDKGDLSINVKVDREQKSFYNLSASIVNFQTRTKLDEEEYFTVIVQDINDNIPVFPPDISASISEASSAGTEVMTVEATDSDDPTTINGMIEYALINGTDIFKMDSSGVIKTLKNNLDREKQHQYKVIVRAKDLPGTPVGNSVSTIVTINVTDVNDNIAAFRTGNFRFGVKEDTKPGADIGLLWVEDRDEIQNKDPTFTIQHTYDKLFHITLSAEKDGKLKLKVPLDYETVKMYVFSVNLDELTVSKSPDNQFSNPLKKAQVYIDVIDVDEPPVFSQSVYKFSVLEGPFQSPEIGSVSAKDPDKPAKTIRYSIEDPNCPLMVNPVTGFLSLKKPLDREQASSHVFQVIATEDVPNGLKSYATVNLKVLDINDNAPELTNGTNVYVCESDRTGTIIGVIGAHDKDEISGNFRFTLAKKSSNFSLQDNQNNTASIILKKGGFSTDHSVEHVLEIEISDGGKPEQKSINLLHIKVCTCQSGRRAEYCMAFAKTGVSVSALLAILLCIVTILVIVILIVLRRRQQSDALISKSSGEIHEQLVRYDEEGGGEMDTNGYDVSILTSACHRPAPSLYAAVKKPPACKGDMAVMIEVKKDEADGDRDGIPYDTLHIYGYEGCDSLAGSLSSLDSSSSGAFSVDYDALSDWGPRFRTLAQLYGAGGSDTDSSC